MSKPRRAKPNPRAVIGWREWVGLPGFGVSAIKAKVDTGARSSALHAFNLRWIERDGARFVTFEVHPLQRKTAPSFEVESEVIDIRSVRSSSGKSELRPVVVTPVTVGSQTWDIEVTLTGRDAMGFRMLLGRQAVRGRFIVDPGRSFVLGKPGGS